MNQNKQIPNIFLCASLIVLAAVWRIINAEMHWYHIAPLVAISLFSGSILQRKSYAYILPLAAYLISDVYIELTQGNGFYGISQFFVYGGMALVVALGTFMKKQSLVNVFGYSIGGSLLFWLVSNLGVFFSGYNGLNLSGLVTTYVMALPFLSKDGVSTELFFNSIVGDVIFSGILFGLYAMLKNKVLAPKAIA
jgi:hypothetical protein